MRRVNGDAGLYEVSVPSAPSSFSKNAGVKYTRWYPAGKGVPVGREVGVLERDGELGNSEGRLSVSERSWSWLASRVWERVCGPRDWKRVRKDVAIVDAEVSVRSAGRMENVRVSWGVSDCGRRRCRVEQRVIEGRDMVVIFLYCD